MPANRIAIFDNWLPFHIGLDTKNTEKDEPIKWLEFIKSPIFKLVYEKKEEKYYTLNDKRAIDEIHRILTHQTCPICRIKMAERPSDFNEKIFVCLKCGYWGGRGSRMDNVYEAVPLRGVIGIYKPIQPLSDLTTEYLITHLKKHPEQLPKIGPKRAEKFIIDLLKDYLNCEVRLIGGAKDKGVDGFVLNGEDVKSIVQIKWRENMQGAESVKVVREVAGTLLARGVPSGIIVSNKKKFSKDAIEDAEKISGRVINEIGRMYLDLFDYNNILDMLEISSVMLTEKMSIEDWINIEVGYEVFEGAMKIQKEFVDMFKH